MTDTQSMTVARGQPVIVTLPAEIDMANVDALGEQLAAAFAPSTRVAIADMTATTFCDSIGIGMLVRAQKQATPGAPNCGCCCRARTCCAS
jgi:anti-sigma B factor antagonist